MEYGVVFSQGITTLLEAVPDALADLENELTATIRNLLAGLLDDIRFLNRDIEELASRIAALCKKQICSGQVKLATVLYSSQYLRSNSFGVSPPLY